MPGNTYLTQVVAHTLQYGGSASQPDKEIFLPDRDLWCFPKYPSRTRILHPQADLISALQRFICENETYLSESDCWLGTWVHPHTGEFYLDISTGIADLDEAQRTAKQAGEREGRMIVAIFNPAQQKTVYLSAHPLS